MEAKELKELMKESLRKVLKEEVKAMTLSTSPKDKITEHIRQQIGKVVPEAVETDRAEASLCSLPFQSKTHPERHIWIDTDNQQIQIDLED